MFCVATAPAPARACAQRAATAGDDEAIATPNIGGVGAARNDGEGHRLSSRRV